MYKKAGGWFFAHKKGLVVDTANPFFVKSSD
jgi:hypothetical protein